MTAYLCRNSSLFSLSSIIWHFKAVPRVGRNPKAISTVLKCPIGDPDQWPSSLHHYL